MEPPTWVVALRSVRTTGAVATEAVLLEDEAGLPLPPVSTTAVPAPPATTTTAMPAMSGARRLASTRLAEAGLAGISRIAAGGRLVISLTIGHAEVPRP